MMPTQGRTIEKDAEVHAQRGRQRPIGGEDKWSLASITELGCARWPTRTAVVDPGTRLTFAQLYHGARCVAHRLRELGVNPGDRVAVAGPRTADTVLAILGVSLAGAAYVPLDVTQPAARLNWLLQDADVCGVVAAEALRSLVPGLPKPTFFVPVEGLALRVQEIPEGPNPRVAETDPASVAYVMYTSGSTGSPKGVQIEHRQLQAFFEAHNERVCIGPGDRILSTGPFHFDVSLLDVFLPLHFGATVFLASALPVPTLILSALEKYAITHFYAVGTLLGLITGDGDRLDRYRLDALRVLQTGAEVCNIRVVNEWLRRYPNLRFLNSYGPTEATVGCISYLKSYPGPLADSDCPIGKPHTGTKVELLGTSGNVLTDPGVVGELAIGGAQIMRGYWRRTSENRLAFVNIEGQSYYRTGDYAYRDQNGDFRFVGRRDDEIKLNGFRIHLNEICRCLQNHECVQAVQAGLVSSQTSNPELAVAVAIHGTSAVDCARELSAHVASQLPKYMQPTRWALIQAFPRLPSGKADRAGIMKSLEEAVRTHDAQFYCQSDEALNPLEM